jgi:zinc transporter ZupT
MVKKEWYKSKTIQAALFIGLVGAVSAVEVFWPGSVTRWAEVMEKMLPLAAGWAIYGLRTAEKKIA